MRNSSSPERKPAEAGTIGQSTQSGYTSDKIGILRAPVYPTTVAETLVICERQQLRERVIALLNEPVFLEAVYIAAPGLHAKAVAWLNGDNSLVDIDLAIARYALRMSHRSTPFGTFSSVAALTIGPSDTDVCIADIQDIRKLVTVDYVALAEIAAKVIDGDDGSIVRYCLNDTITIHSDYISYLKLHRHASGHAQHVAELERSEELDFVLEAISDCRGITSNELAVLIFDRFGSTHTQEDVRTFVDDLRTHDVLVADSLLDPTSDDQISTLINRLAVVPPQLKPVYEVAELLRNLAGTPLGDGVEDLSKIGTMLLAAGSTSGKSSHVVAYAPSMSGSLSEICLRQVEGAVTALASYTPRNSRLKSFKDRFVERYGESAVPLSDLVLWLDTMGYPDQVRPAAPLADQVSAAKKSKPRTPAAALNGPESYAVSLMSTSGSSEFIDISGFRNPSRGSAASRPLPSCLVAWLRLWNGGPGKARIELQSVGSQQPGRIMGRFSGVLPAVLKHLNEAEKPSAGKLFAQIVAIPENRAGSVISRAATDSPEIRVRAGGGSDDIKLSDLDVFVSNGRVSLWSRSRNVEVVPQMNSAHSYHKCKGASVYVLLNDLSNQDEVCHMPSLRKKLREAPYLPGLTYQGMIVDRPSWHVTAEELELSRCTDEQGLDRLRSWAQRLNLPKICEHYETSRTQILSLCSDWMARDFIKELRKSGSLTLTCVFPMQMRPHLRSSSGPHMHEIQVALRSKLLPQDVPMPKHTHRRARAAMWVYVCAYCKVASQNAVIESLSSSVKAAAGDQNPFFFVRYRDKDGEHVRFRVKAESTDDRLTLMRSIEEVCLKLEDVGVLNSFAFRTYVPEVDRYMGPNLMELAEKVFAIDSRSVIRSFGRIPKGVHDHWRSAAIGADALLKATGVESLSDRLAFATRAAASYQREFDFDATQRRSIGLIFKNSEPVILDTGECAPGIPSTFDLIDSEQVRHLLMESQDFLALGDRKAYPYRWSLVHMHFNRVFTRDARLQEAICWELLKRSYLRCTKKMEVSVA